MSQQTGCDVAVRPAESDVSQSDGPRVLPAVRTRVRSLTGILDFEGLLCLFTVTEGEMFICAQEISKVKCVEANRAAVTDESK